MPANVPRMGAVLLDRASGVLALRDIAAGVQEAAESQHLSGEFDAATSAGPRAAYDWRAYLAHELKAARREARA